MLFDLILEIDIWKLHLDFQLDFYLLVNILVINNYITTLKGLFTREATRDNILI